MTANAYADLPVALDAGWTVTVHRIAGGQSVLGPFADWPAANHAAAALVDALNSAPNPVRGPRGAYKDLPRVLSPRQRPNGLWRGRYLDRDGRDRLVPRDLQRASKTEALAASRGYLDELRVADARGATPAPLHPVAHYIANIDRWPCAVDPQTFRSYKDRLNVVLRFAPRNGPEAPKKVDDYTRLDVVNIKTALVHSGLKYEYGVRVLEALRTLFRDLAAAGYEVDDPAATVRFSVRDRKLMRTAHHAARPASSLHRARHVSADEYHATLEGGGASPQLRAVLDAVVASGMRPGEMLLLNRTRADVAAETYKVAQRQPRSGQPQDGTKTTHHLEPEDWPRTTPLPGVLVEALDTAFGVPLDGYYLRTPRGKFWLPDNYRTRIFTPFMKAARDAGATEGWTLKDLRHTFDTELQVAGIPFGCVAAWMGHSVVLDASSGSRLRVRSQTTSTYFREEAAGVRVPQAVNVMLSYLRRGQQQMFTVL